MPGKSFHLLSALRRTARPIILAAVRFFAAHPGVHEKVKQIYAYVPGLQRRLRQLLPPAQPVVADRWVLEPVPPEDGKVLTIENLYYLANQHGVAET